MAMIKCPNCGQDISDKAPKCVHCGVEIPPPETKEEMVVCEECGKEFPKDADLCPFCGCPAPKSEEPIAEEPKPEPEKKVVPNEKQPIPEHWKIVKPNRHKKKAIIALSVVACFIVALVILYNIGNKWNYEDNYVIAVEDMKDGCQFAEKCCDTIRSTWTDAELKLDTSKTRGFTQENGVFVSSYSAVSAAQRSPGYTSMLGQAKDRLESVGSLLDEMGNPPLSYKKAHESLVELYGCFQTLYEMAENPSGGLIDYADENEKLMSQIEELFDVVAEYLPEK